LLSGTISSSCPELQKAINPLIAQLGDVAHQKREAAQAQIVRMLTDAKFYRDREGFCCMLRELKERGAKNMSPEISRRTLTILNSFYPYTTVCS
jgi:hypothetical protein